MNTVWILKHGHLPSGCCYMEPQPSRNSHCGLSSSSHGHSWFAGILHYRRRPNHSNFRPWYIIYCFFYLYNLETHGDLGIPILRYRSLFHDHCAMAASVPGLFGPNAPALGALERKAWKMSDFTEDFGGNVAMNTPFMES